MASQNRKKQRRLNYIEPVERIYIFCEGEQTEPLYFDGFVKEIKKNPIYKNTVFIEVIGLAKETLRVVEDAEKYVEQNKIKNANIWCVYDKDSFPEKIQKFIGDHYFEDVSTADAARAVCISVSRLCHILKENSMGTFSQMLTAERIYHAKQFLTFSDSDLRLFEIAALCGFREYEHFSRTFKKETGVTPAAWRKEHQL